MTATDPGVQRSTRFWNSKWAIFAAPVLLLLVFFGWGLSSPAGSSPDDNFHVASIWCAYGDRDGLCESNGQPDERLVPASVAHMTCFAFESTTTGACQGDLAENPSTEMVPVNHGNWNGHTYPPLFFGLFGLFASQNLAISVLTIRFINALIATVALSATFFALPTRLRPMLAVSTAIAYVPLGLFIIPSTNPSSWALLSAAMVFPAVFAISRTTGKRRWALVGLAVAGALLGAGARADAAAYAALAAVIAVFLSRWRDKSTLITAGVIVIMSATFYLTAGQADGLNGLSTDPNIPSSGVALLIYNIMQLPSLWLGMFTNLGWLDTAISPLAIFALVFVSIGVVFTALSSISWKKAIALCAAVGALTLLPLYVLNSSHASVGSQVQPRYILPLFILVLAVAMAPMPNVPPRFSTVQVWVMAALLMGAQAIALYDELTRYIAGERILNIDAGEWWWGGSPVSPLFTLAIASLAFAGLIALLARSFVQFQRTESDTISIDSAAAPHALSR